jgi:hypothetical protein
MKLLSVSDASADAVNGVEHPVLTIHVLAIELMVLPGACVLAVQYDFLLLSLAIIVLLPQGIILTAALDKSRAGVGRFRVLIANEFLVLLAACLVWLCYLLINA